MTYALVNGAFIEENTATISINDRGFRFGDGLFETIPVYDGLPYLWEYHMERLAGGLKALSISCDTRDLLQQALVLLKSNAVIHSLLRIQISRGVGSQGYLPAPGTLSPTIVMQTLDCPASPPSAVTLWLSSFQKPSTNSLPVRYKLAQGVNSMLARMEAADHNCFDALQPGEGNCVGEASSANIFWLREGRLHTPSLACGVLAGITRRRIIELSPHPISEGSYTLDDMAAADAVILTNASLGAVAVNSLLPLGKTWESTAFAATINTLRNRDIRKHTGQLRESLALI